MNSSWRGGLRRALCLCWLAFGFASAASSADQWNAGTLTGSGRTETLTMCYTHTSTTATCIPRRATSLTNALTKYVANGSGGLTASTVTPTSRTNFASINSVGGNSTTSVLGGAGVWMESAALSDLTTWTSQEDAASAGNTYAGTITPTSPDKTFQIGNICPGCSSSIRTRLFNFSISPKSNGNIATSTVTPGDTEMVGTSVSATYYCIVIGEYSSGTPTFFGYTSGTSFAYTTTSSTATMNTSSYYYPPFGLGSTACVATVKRQSNSHTYIQSAPIGGTITTVDAGVIDLMPLGDWNPTGSLQRGWWVNKADGTVRVSNSGTTVGSISTNATYDIGATPLGGSTPLFAITGLDMDGDGDATDNPVVLMADGSHFAWWGSPASSGVTRVPVGAFPINSFPYATPGVKP